MESGSDLDFHEKRLEVRGGLSDQGTERGLGDDTILSHPRYADYDNDDPDMLFMYPLCLMLPGMLHVLYNALQEAILSIPSSSEFLEHLRIIESFFCNKELRSAFQHQCFRSYEERKLSDAYSTVHIDWKWEFLSRALDKLVPLLSLVALRFTIESMTASGSSLLKTSLTTTVAAICCS